MLRILCMRARSPADMGGAWKPLMNESRNSHSRMRWAAGALAFACGAAGITLAIQYPLAQPWLPAIFLAMLVVFWAKPYHWLLVLPTLLPVAGFAPWTGWLTFEEADMLVLAVASAGYLRYALRGPLQLDSREAAATVGAGAMLVITLFVLTVVAAMLHGFADAGGYQFGWLQGYHEPMNSVRLAKSILAPVLLLPLWHEVHRAYPQRTTVALAWGLITGLVATSMAAVWERVAFVGLLDFSSDYRTTGLFWEMHVGGAALDGFLALTVPFALRELLTARTHSRWAISAGVLALAAYACLTTFSRGVYLAVPLGLISLLVLHGRQKKSGATVTETMRSATVARHSNWAGLVLILGFGACAGWMFQTSGYRGLLALLGAMALALPLADTLRSSGIRSLLAGCAGGVLLATLAVACGFWVPKGAYLAYILAAGFTLLVYVMQRRQRMSAELATPLALAGLLTTLAAAVLVAVHWGYSPAMWPAIGASVFVLLVALVGAAPRQPLWPGTLRWQAGMVATMGMVAATIGVFSGGAYMGDRLASGNRDLSNRFDHWKLGLDMLQTPTDWWLGKGLGRYPANHFLVGDPSGHPGDYRLAHESGNNYLRLAGGLHINGRGEIFRVTQRIAVPTQPVKLGAQVRTATDVTLVFEACEKHLLYSQGCMTREVSLKASPGKWQAIDTTLTGDNLYGGRWYAPRLISFAVAMGTRGGVADLDQLTLTGSSGENLLANGDFVDGMAHWFSSSDKHHLPWHMKSMVLHVLFEQGILGLSVWTLLVGAALMRLTVGQAKQHPMAPALVAAMLGFFVVGLFDSLLDVPRVATLFYFFVLLGLTLGVARPLEAPVAESTTAKPVPRRGASRGEPDRASASARVIKALGVSFFALFILAGLVALLATWAGRSPAALMQITPGEWIRHAKLALAQDALLTKALLPPLEFVQSTIERPPPGDRLSTLGKGQQTRALPLQRYLPTGEPLVAVQAGQDDAPLLATLQVRSAAEFSRALATAKPGQVVEVMPGHYKISELLATGSAGTPLMPITFRASKPGDVIIEFDLVQGIHVTQPYWVFENLTIRGTCGNDAKCEHAFHVVGAARGTVLRNNRLEDFNAHIKINGEGGKWPDHGLVQFNTLTNARPRQTNTPITPVDLVAASDWQVLDNVIRDFASATGDRVSYGVFMKGAGTDGTIARNLIICTSKDISRAGVRVGISWGGGRTDPANCRDGMCANEYTRGLAANNVIAHCNDAGIDVNGSSQISLSHNTLVNTAGIQVRGHANDIDLHANLLDGRIRSAEDSTVTLNGNEVGSLKQFFLNPDHLQLGHAATGPVEVAVSQRVSTDFCNRTRESVTRVGANAAGAPACARPAR